VNFVCLLTYSDEADDTDEPCSSGERSSVRRTAKRSRNDSSRREDDDTDELCSSGEWSSVRRTAKRSRNDSSRREDDDTDELCSSGEWSSAGRTAKGSKDQKLVKKPNENVLHSRINAKRTRWTAEHLALLKKSFMHMKKPPNAKLIKKLLKNEPSLHSRTIPQIKSTAWALINSKMAGTR